MEIVGYLLGGAAVAAVITAASNILLWKLNRKAAKEDQSAANDTAWHKNVEEQMAALVESNRLIMLDRIKYLGQAYIRDNEVDFDDRRLLHQMHETYHNKLGGNGDLDLIIAEVDKLPLKNERMKSHEKRKD